MVGLVLGLISGSVIDVMNIFRFFKFGWFRFEWFLAYKKSIDSIDDYQEIRC